MIFSVFEAVSFIRVKTVSRSEAKYYENDLKLAEIIVNEDLHHKTGHFFLLQACFPFSRVVV